MRSPCPALLLALLLGLLPGALVIGCNRAEEASKAPLPPEREPSPHLLVWAGDVDGQDSDFLAVIDAAPQSDRYADILTTLPVGVGGTMPHHTQYEYPSDHRLFANGWSGGRTFVLDLSKPMQPRVVGQFDGLEGYSFPHSFADLANGRALATFQSSGEGYVPPGGLVEIDRDGTALRSVSAATESLDAQLTWPYSLVVHEELGLAVSTSSEMGIEPFDEYEFQDTRHVQLWTLEPLALRNTIALPTRNGSDHHLWPSEPRLLADGTVYVVTFSCGLFRLIDLDGPSPSAEFVHAFPGGDLSNECGVPVVVGDYWIQTVPALPGLVVLDVSDPASPVVASELVLDEEFVNPHWVAADRASNRIVITGNMADWVLVAVFDPESGRLELDEQFRARGSERPGLRFDRAQWPHGASGGAHVHAALFRPPDR